MVAAARLQHLVQLFETLFLQKQVGIGERGAQGAGILVVPDRGLQLRLAPERGILPGQRDEEREEECQGGGQRERQEPSRNPVQQSGQGDPQPSWGR